MKEKLKNRILKVVHSPGFLICVGLIIVVMSILDIKEDITKMRKEHITLLIGALMIISAINDFLGGVKKILTGEATPKTTPITIRIDKIMHSPAYYCVIGIIIVVVSSYDIYEDFLNIKKEHLGVILGIVYMLIALAKVYEGGHEAYEGIEEELRNTKKDTAKK